MSKNPDGSLWTREQWREHILARLADPPKFSDKLSKELSEKLSVCIREAHEMILSAPEDFTPEQMANLASHATASVMGLAVGKAKRP